MSTDVALLSTGDVLEVLPSAPASNEVRDAVRSGLTVSNPAGTALVELTVVATSPQVAANAASTVAQQYILMRAERATAARMAYIAALGDANEASKDDLLAARHLDATVYGSQVGEVVRRAQADPEPASLGPAPFLAAGVLGGALLGALAALVRERRDPRIGTSERLARALGAPTVYTTNLSAAAVGREVASAVRAGTSGWPGRVGVVVPGGVADRAARRVVAGLHLAGATTTAAQPGPGLGPQIETVALPDPSTGPDLYGIWWSVQTVVVVCTTETNVTETTRCAQAAAATGASVLGVLLDPAQ